jgi:hypothetical protein
MLFDTSISISYDTDDEYRVCLGKIFGKSFQAANNENGEEMSDILAKIYEATIPDPHFSHLYRRGAALILSDDLELGITFMFSYSCLGKFWMFLSMFLTKAHMDSEGQQRFEYLLNDLNQILDDLESQ